MASQPVQAVLYRILGNDLPPRYSTGQTLANLRFTLEHEPELPGLEKRWLLNRIVCPDNLATLQDTIRATGQRFDVIPFEVEAYRQVWTDLGTTPQECHPWSEAYQQLPRLMQLRISDYIARFKNQYLMNNNGARNRAIALGLADAEWVLPWDGGCFLPAWAWEEMQAAMADAQWHYLCVPMHRLADNASIPGAEERDAVSWDEPQLAFSRHAQLHFDANLRYGSMPKALLLRRIGLPGPWQDSVEGWLPWEQPELTPAADEGAFQLTGLVLRLSGDQQDTRHTDLHGLWGLRFAGILKFTREVDLQIMRRQMVGQAQLTLLQWPIDGCQVVFDMVTSVSPSPRGWEELPADAFCRLALRAQQDSDLIAIEQARTFVKGWCLDQVTALDASGMPLTEVTKLEGLVRLSHGLTLLQKTPLLSAEELQELHSWWERLLAWLLTGSQEFLENHHYGHLPVAYHLALLVVGLELKKPLICCLVADNLPALADDSSQLDDRIWRSMSYLCKRIGRDIEVLFDRKI